MAEDKNVKEKTDALNKEVKNLNENKTKYKNMNKKIEEALIELKKAKQYLDTAHNELKKNYSSETASKKSVEFQNEINAINKLIKKLNDTILPESNRQINSINSKVTNKNDEIQKLNKGK